MIPYQHLNEFLARENASCGAAELQGFLCAWLLNTELTERPSLNDAQFSEPTLAFMDVQETGISEALQQCIEALAEMQWTQLSQDEYEWRLLLPDDDSPLAERSAALAAWSSAFLFGFSSTRNHQNIDAETQEILSDLVQLSQLDLNDIHEEDEADYTELAEYVRAALFSLFAAKPRPTKPKHSHRGDFGLSSGQSLH